MRFPQFRIRNTAQASPGKLGRLPRTPAGSTHLALDGYGLRDQLLARPTKPASYPVSVRQVAVLLHASFRHHLAAMPLRFANPSPPSGWIEDFHFPATEHAGHTTEPRSVRAPPPARRCPGPMPLPRSTPSSRPSPTHSIAARRSTSRASANSLPTTLRRAREGIPAPAKPSPSPRAPCRLSSPARLFATGSTARKASAAVLPSPHLWDSSPARVRISSTHEAPMHSGRLPAVAWTPATGGPTGRPRRPREPRIRVGHRTSSARIAPCPISRRSGQGRSSASGARRRHSRAIMRPDHPIPGRLGGTASSVCGTSPVSGNHRSPGPPITDPHEAKSRQAAPPCAQA